MPKIKITEIDKTKASISGGASNTVFMPFVVETTNDKFGPVLVSKVSELKDLVPEDLQTNADESWFMITSLIGAGLMVLVQGVTSSTDIIWTKEGLADKSLYDIRFLTTGALVHATKSTVESVDTWTDDGTNASMLQCAALRGDSIAIIDHAIDLVSPKKIRDFVGTPPEAHATFGAMFTPAVQFATSYTATTVEGEDEVTTTESIVHTLPASFAFLMAYAASILSNPSWLAIAGYARGGVPGLIRPIVEFGGSAIDTLQARKSELDDSGDNTGFAINPICFIRPVGYLIWGNRTLRVNAGTKALSFLNVRNLVVELKKVLFEEARRLTFEQNSDILWVKFTSAIYPVLDRMVSGNGISGYRVVKEATEAKARLKASIRIFPIEAVEDFEISVLLEDEDAQIAINE